MSKISGSVGQDNESEHQLRLYRTIINRRTDTDCTERYFSICGPDSDITPSATDISQTQTEPCIYLNIPIRNTQKSACLFIFLSFFYSLGGGGTFYHGNCQNKFPYITMIKESLEREDSFTVLKLCGSAL